MSIRQEELNDDTWLVAVSGRLDQTQTAELESAFDALIDAGHVRLVVDLSEVTYINSGGLRCLVTAWRKAKQDGGNLFLTGLRARVREVFDMVGFDKVFEVFPDRRSAAAAWTDKQ
jgi:anti-anti-sigma factor